MKLFLLLGFLGLLFPCLFAKPAIEWNNPAKQIYICDPLTLIPTKVCVAHCMQLGRPGAYCDSYGNCICRHVE